MHPAQVRIRALSPRLHDCNSAGQERNSSPDSPPVRTRNKYLTLLLQEKNPSTQQRESAKPKVSKHMTDRITPERVLTQAHAWSLHPMKNTSHNKPEIIANQDQFTNMNYHDADCINCGENQAIARREDALAPEQSTKDDSKRESPKFKDPCRSHYNHPAGPYSGPGASTRYRSSPTRPSRPANTRVRPVSSSLLWSRPPHDPLFDRAIRSAGNEADSPPVIVGRRRWRRWRGDRVGRWPSGRVAWPEGFWIWTTYRSFVVIIVCLAPRRRWLWSSFVRASFVSALRPFKWHKPLVVSR